MTSEARSITYKVLYNSDYAISSSTDTDGNTTSYLTHTGTSKGFKGCVVQCTAKLSDTIDNYEAATSKTEPGEYYILRSTGVVLGLPENTIVQYGTKEYIPIDYDDISDSSISLSSLIVKKQEGTCTEYITMLPVAMRQSRTWTSYNGPDRVVYNKSNSEGPKYDTSVFQLNESIITARPTRIMGDSDDDNFLPTTEISGSGYKLKPVNSY